MTKRFLKHSSVSFWKRDVPSCRCKKMGYLGESPRKWKVSRWRAEETKFLGDFSEAAVGVAGLAVPFLGRQSLLNSCPGSSLGRPAQARTLCAGGWPRTLASSIHFWWENIKANTEVDDVAKQYIVKGLLVPDHVSTHLIMSELESTQDQHWLLDGFPKTIVQAEALEGIIPAHIGSALLVGGCITWTLIHLLCTGLMTSLVYC